MFRKKNMTNIKIIFFSINAGCAALPALLNIKQVMQQRQVDGIWNGKDELPVWYIYYDFFYYIREFFYKVLTIKYYEI